MAVYVGQAAVDAVVAEGEAFVVDAQQVQQRGVDVVAVGGVVGRLCKTTRRSRRSVTPPLMPPPASQLVKPNGLWSRPCCPGVHGMRPNSVVQSTIVSSSMPRCFRSLIERRGRLVHARRPCRRDRVAMFSCESQLRRGKPLSAPLQTCTNRTPRSSSRRATRQLRPKSLRRPFSIDVRTARCRRARSLCDRSSDLRGAELQPGGQLVGAIRASSRESPARSSAMSAVELLQHVQAARLRSAK